ncbi:MAG TPA: cyclodeaminase/cyclohydrolase family protein [Clostridia bacterium]|nr:cyclodeaminase/cyclohydrolase family protein [Clostridia bacterium]
MFTDLPLRAYLEKIAKPDFPTPKGGSAAAMAAALGGALLSMSAQVTAKNSPNSQLLEIWTQAENISLELSYLADEDVQAYYRVIESFRLPQYPGTDEQKRRQAIEESFQNATETLLEIAENCSRLLELEGILAPFCSKSCRGDLETARLLTLASLQASLELAASNYNKIPAGEFRQMVDKKFLDFRNTIKEGLVKTARKDGQNSDF